jgi:hypothetical protein
LFSDDFVVVDYTTAKRTLKTDIVTSFSKTKFRNAELRVEGLLWATGLPSGKTPDSQIETVYHMTHNGSEIRLGKPGYEAIRKTPNLLDMTPLLYEMRHGRLARSTKGFTFSEMLREIKAKISKDEEAGHVLLAMLYRCGVLDDHSFSNNVLRYEPNTDIMKWLDDRFLNFGETPASELIPLYDAIMLNEDVKLYTNPDKYNSVYLKPFEPRGRINTLGAIFVVCASESVLSRIDACGLLIRGRGTPAIFSATYDYGRKIIAPMTDNIVDFHQKQETLR